MAFSTSAWASQEQCDILGQVLDEAHHGGDTFDGPVPDPIDAAQRTQRRELVAVTAARVAREAAAAVRKSAQAGVRVVFVGELPHSDTTYATGGRRGQGCPARCRGRSSQRRWRSLMVIAVILPPLVTTCTVGWAVPIRGIGRRSRPSARRAFSRGIECARECDVVPDAHVRA